MSRVVVVRLHAKGPIGFVRVDDGAAHSLADFRRMIDTQLGPSVVPDEFAFLLDSVPVARAQEAHEPLEEYGSDVFISEYGTRAAWSSGTLSGTETPSLVQRWLSDFAFMSADEQREALECLQLRLPAAASKPTKPAAKPASARIKKAAVAVMAASPPAGRSRTASASSALGGGRSLSPPPRGSRACVSGAAMAHHPFDADGACTPAGSRATIDLSGLYEGAAPPESKPAPGGAPRPKSLGQNATYHTETLASVFRTMHFNARDSHGAGHHLFHAHGGAQAGAVSQFTASLRASKPPGAHTAVSPRKQGKHIEPVAFGSGRPQRPSSASMKGSSSVPALGRHGSLNAVY